MKNKEIRKILVVIMSLAMIIAFNSTVLAAFGSVSANSSIDTADMPLPQIEDDNNKNDELVPDAQNKEKNDMTEAGETVVGRISRKEKRIAELTDKYNDEVYGKVAYYLEVAQKYSLPICFIGIAMGSFNFLIVGNKKLDKKEQGYGWIVGFVIGLVVFNVMPLLFALFVAGRGA